jgi:hypothetical protein
MKEVSVIPPLNPKRIDPPLIKRNPYDISTWGSECGRGIPYADLGTKIAGRQNVLKISQGRKARGKRT